jgi:hypothetical protein
VTLLAKGGYNDVWLVKSTATRRYSRGIPDLVAFILRVPNEESLKPHQIRNEIGWLKYMAEHAPDIPVPTIYDYADGVNDQPFIAMQYIEATSLSEAWASYNEAQKGEMARQLAGLVVRLGELQFDQIGGMTPSGTLGPTIEGAKLFKGRNNFHHSAYYDVGPYLTIKQYILA